MLNKVFSILFFSLLAGVDIDKNFKHQSYPSLVGTSFDVAGDGQSQNRYIWLHGDEETARMALEYHMENHSGLAFFIKNKTREIPFKSTIIDPNRIFSRDGAYHALRKFKPSWSDRSLQKALDEIENDRKIFLDIIMPIENGLLISVHNNFRGYNVFKEKRNSQKTSIKSNENPRDFIICTNNEDFEKLSKGPFNVVLQNKLPKNDDGSLSWEALRRNIRYLNIETRLGYLSKQKKMLRFIEKELN